MQESTFGTHVHEPRQTRESRFTGVYEGIGLLKSLFIPFIVQVQFTILLPEVAGV